MKKQIMIFLALLLMLCGCSGPVEEEQTSYKVWYINTEGTGLESAMLDLNTEDTEEGIRFCLDALASSDRDGTPLLDEEISVQEFKVEGGSLTLNMDPAYTEMPKTREILVRAGIVRTLTQLPDIYRVAFTVDGSPLRDSNGSLYGYQTAESFVENSGADMNQYQYVTLTLYFANEAGDQLVKESRTVAYSSGKPLERVVVEQLINGPEETGHTRVLSEGTNILSATSSEKIAYVNFDNTVQSSVLPVSKEVVVYALVDSIIDNCKDEKVQFSINGQNDVKFQETVDLSHFFEADFSLLEVSK